MRSSAKLILPMVVVGIVAASAICARAQNMPPYPGLDQSYGLPTNPLYMRTAAAAPAARVAVPARSMVNSLGTTSATTLPMTGHARNAIGFFGSKSAETTLQSMPRRPSIAPGAAVVGRRPKPSAKPFDTVSQQPTVSPYLNLYREENDESAPNYYSFVRPALQQQAANQQNQLQLERLSRQIQGVSAATTSIPPTGYRTRFMNTGQYYKTLAR